MLQRTKHMGCVQQKRTELWYWEHVCRLGMVLGEQAVSVAKQRFMPPAPTSIREVPGDIHGPS
jgi:hypothetical protein